MMAVTLAFNLMLMGNEATVSLVTDKDKIEFLLSHYPDLNNWQTEDNSSEKE